MTRQPIPTAVHPDNPATSPVGRDAPAADFVAMLERSGADPSLVETVRSDW